MSFAQARPIPGAVATAGVNERVTFLRKTYAHLGGAILAFVALTALIVNSSLGTALFHWAMGSRLNWFLLLGLFMFAGWVSERWARSDTSRGKQYLGLGLYIVAEAIIFTPLLYIASTFDRFENVIPQAGLATVVLFAGLTATVFLTKKDFSFLRGALTIGAFAALALIGLSLLFGFELGILFVVGMLVLATGYVLFYTSRVLAYYPPTQYVSASLALFASIALLFFYILQLFMSLRD
ncbi:Bax inhibitor-1/YccA family protein [Haliangium ochraceum]|uniref:Permease n=1 Tax=Haliangium ochraceum (strain DSM 14365 / JCM 11303 / SMP-2) TaxID=502025 RepID=D0LRQ7_HALO1|nr:Bax inhibitor-1 family protein [Haliangium ochraceum]ACY19049.1 conserved hypothetical protein [Haliangium ochraceum DSM 14365]